ncbi:MAG: HAD hydrolase-like protein [Bacillaceae bacterium]
MKTAVIFDMDGTLFQTSKILEPSLIDTFDDLRSKGLWTGNTPIEKYNEIMGVPLPVVWETLLSNKTTGIHTYANDVFHQSLIANITSGKGALYPHVIEIFTYLKEQGIPIFIASNGIKRYLEAIVNHYKFSNWIDGVYSIEQIESLEKSKLVKWILEQHAIEKGAVVGDRLSDIKAAKENGLIAIGCRFDFAQEEELKQADYIIDDFRQLKEICMNIKRVDYLEL